MNNWYKEMLQQKEWNEEMLKRANRELAQAPPGNLRMSHYKGIPRFYQRNAFPGAKDRYLNQEQEDLRNALAQKKYIEMVKGALESENRAIEGFAKTPFPSVEDVFEFLPDELQAMVKSLVPTDEEYVKTWLSKMSKGASGEELKSRIEIIFHQDFKIYEVPHVYEPALYLKGFGNVRPDFVALNVRTRQTFYHEHLGMLDDEEYRLRNMRKLRAYHKNGFYEGINLIVTMESDGKKIDYHEIEQLVKTYLT